MKVFNNPNMATSPYTFSASSRLPRLQTFRFLRACAKHIYLYFSFPYNALGVFRGVYESFEEALAAAPTTKPIGYDHKALAKVYAATTRERIATRNLRSWDMMPLVWIARIITQNNHRITVFDFGGNVGTHFLLYQPFLAMHRIARWTVCELPAIVAEGEALKEHYSHIYNTETLHFTTNLGDLDTHSSSETLFFASGAVQYLDQTTLDGIISKHPAHILITRLTTTDGDTFVTLQNGGMVFYPQYVFNEAAFIALFLAGGYELIHAWNDDATTFIPLHSKKSVHYRGFYLCLNSKEKDK